ncbi:hypothetical protein BH10BAC5_BH10BAC5_13420 [soil metagenome]
MINSVTLPARIREIMEYFALNIKSILPVSVKGIYLTGSTALNDYYSMKSDIDFIVIIDEIPETDILDNIEQLHFRIEKMFKHPKLNGYYLTIKGIQSGQLAFPSFYMGKMHNRRRLELNKVVLYELLTSSLRISGLYSDELTITVDLDDVFEQLHTNINSYWKKWIEKHSEFPWNLKLALIPRLTEWGVLGVSRQLYTLQTGKITSKLNAGLHYLQHHPEHFQDILRISISERKINRTKINLSFSRAQKTLKCMNHIIREFNSAYKSSKI